MEVAVLIYRHHGVLAVAELRDGRLAGLQTAELATAGSLKIDETDMVLREHRMGDGSDLHEDGTLALAGDHRDVFLTGAVGLSGDELFHLASAADRDNAAVDYTDVNVPAMGAFVEFNHRNQF